MFGMSRRHLRHCVNENRVREAIERAEQASSGEIRVSVAAFFWGSVYKAAHRAFVRLGMDQTAERNGVLIFIVPSRKRIVVLGDEGIHAAVGQAFWEELTSIFSSHFHKGDFTEGLVEGIHRIGDRLAEHFPHQGEHDKNELPDHVDYSH